jgi:hypothetical protein
MFTEISVLCGLTNPDRRLRYTCPVSLDKSSKRRRITHAVDMTILPDPEPLWELSDADLLACSTERYPIALGGSLVSDDRLLVVMTTDAGDLLVGFSLVQLTRGGARWDAGDWPEVAEIDSKHGTVHKHQCCRSTRERIGEPQVLMELTCKDDVQNGYSQAYVAMIRDWEANKHRWNNG